MEAHMRLDAFGTLPLAIPKRITEPSPQLARMLLAPLAYGSGFAFARQPPPLRGGRLT